MSAGRPSCWTCLVAFLAIIGVVWSPKRAEAQGIGLTSDTARVTHVAIVVRDIEHSAQASADLVGIDVPAIHSTEGDRGVGSARVAQLRLSNIIIELVQPVGDRQSTYRDLLETRGPGVHHIGLDVRIGDAPLSLTEQSNRLERLGGKVVASGDDFAFFDLTPPLGLKVEAMAPERLARLYGGHAAEPGDTVRPDQLAGPACVTHIGLVVHDIEQSRQVYADLIGVDVPPIQRFDAATGPGEYTIFALTNVSIELIQQVGDSPGTYVDFLNTHGVRVHHLGLHLGGADHSLSKPEQVAWFERHGGRVVVDAGRFAYVDLTPQLGLSVEAMSRAGQERVYPHHCPVP